MPKKKKTQERKPFDYPLTKEEYKELEGYNGMEDIKPIKDDNKDDNDNPLAMLVEYKQHLVTDVDDMMDMYIEIFRETLPNNFLLAVLTIHAELLTVAADRFLSVTKDLPSDIREKLISDVLEQVVRHVGDKLAEVK